MGLKIKVKVGQISNLSDARYCAGMGVDLLGFSIGSESERSVSPELFKAITGWISGPELVGETASSQLPDTDLYNVSFMEVEDPAMVSEIRNGGLNAILKIDMETTSDEETEKLMKNYNQDVRYFLIIKSSQTSVTEAEFAKISKWAEKYPVMLGYGITKENINSIVEHGIGAIAIHGSNEIRPGYKTYDEMADILEELET